VIAGLDWIAGTHPQNSPAVVNMSLGGAASSTLDSAVNNVINRGITVVVAAGNSAANACNYSPARVSAAITVAATTSNDQLASYSNAGSCVDILAPGSGITSAWYTSNDALATLNGTSMASPHVAGVVALALSDGYLSPANLDSQIKSWSTTNLFSGLPSGTPNRFLYSNPTEVVPSPAPQLEVPSDPTGVAATARKRSAEVQWKLPDSDGGSPLTKQTISVWSGTRLVRSVNVTSVATSALIRQLDFKVSYTFSVTATNSVGDGPASLRSNAITPLR
jgi:subtilisin family serine protease